MPEAEERVGSCGMECSASCNAVSLGPGQRAGPGRRATATGRAAFYRSVSAASAGSAGPSTSLHPPAALNPETLNTDLSRWSTRTRLRSPLVWLLRFLWGAVVVGWAWGLAHTVVWFTTVPSAPQWITFTGTKWAVYMTIVGALYISKDVLAVRGSGTHWAFTATGDVFQESMHSLRTRTLRCVSVTVALTLPAVIIFLTSYTDIIPPFVQQVSSEPADRHAASGPRCSWRL